ncbi:MAG: glycosyltransferase [Bacteroidota bacterium]
MKKNNAKNIIITAVKGSYTDFLEVLVQSIRENHRAPLEIGIFYEAVPEEVRSRIERLAASNARIRWLIPEHYFDPQLPYQELLQDPHYWRLLGTIVYGESERIVYLDADTIVRRNLSHLFEIDLEGKVLAAVLDGFKAIEKGIINYKAFDFQADAAYFNSGVLIIDVQRFEVQKIREKVLKICTENAIYLDQRATWPTYDQYGLNVVLYNEWKALSDTYNCSTYRMFTRPHIVHFLGLCKPNTIHCRPEFTAEFFYYKYQSQHNKPAAYQQKARAVFYIFRSFLRQHYYNYLEWKKQRK